MVRRKLKSRSFPGERGKKSASFCILPSTAAEGSCSEQLPVHKPKPLEKGHVHCPDTTRAESTPYLFGKVNHVSDVPVTDDRLFRCVLGDWRTLTDQRERVRCDDGQEEALRLARPGLGQIRPHGQWLHCVRNSPAISEYYAISEAALKLHHS